MTFQTITRTFLMQLVILRVLYAVGKLPPLVLLAQRVFLSSRAVVCLLVHQETFLQTKGPATVRDINKNSCWRLNIRAQPILPSWAKPDIHLFSTCFSFFTFLFCWMRTESVDGWASALGECERLMTAGFSLMQRRHRGKGGEGWKRVIFVAWCVYPWLWQEEYLNILSSAVLKS